MAVSAAVLAAFEDELQRLDFQPGVLREWAAGESVPEHTHAFEVRALMLDGEFTLTVDGHSRTYRAGEVFTLPAGQPHSERMGPTVVRYQVGRKPVSL